MSSHGNKQTKDFGNVLFGALNAKLRSTPFDDPDDAPVTRYGVSFRVPQVKDMNVARGAMREYLNGKLPNNASAHLVEQGASMMVHLNFGKYDDYTLASDAAADLQSKKRFILDVMDKARDFTFSSDDFVWFAEWDWDDDITKY